MTLKIVCYDTFISKIKIKVCFPIRRKRGFGGKNKEEQASKKGLILGVKSKIK
ncbi:hypothetical protein KKD42_02780 [Patescibacteria group bacterium]|nr:hypothetical protein [Patescibacteria group bacterium]